MDDEGGRRKELDLGQHLPFIRLRGKFNPTTWKAEK
jgi:hypothetical protein